jgi:hypothetical protein
MEKTIQLENDRVFKYADRINFNRNHTPDASIRAECARETICDLVIQRKLDAIDLKIIEALDCSPMPTQAEVGLALGISKQAVQKRVVRFRRLFASV